MYSDSESDEDAEPRIVTPQNFNDDIIDLDYAYLTSASGKCKIVEAVLSGIVSLNVLTANYFGSAISIVYVTTFLFTFCFCMFIVFFHTCKKSQKYTNIDWMKYMVGGLICIMFLYDASLKFVTDHFDVNDPVYLMDQIRREQKIDFDKLKIKKEYHIG